MPPRQPHPVRPSAARGTRCLAKVGPRAASATSERGSETRRLLQRNWGRAAEVSVASFLRWGALPRDARFPRWFPMHGGAIFWPAKGVNNSDRLAETYTETYTVGTLEARPSHETRVDKIN